jgi:hypothetical protein
MTPQEKAQELFDKYATYVVMWAGDANTSYQNCKQCALIAVDEIKEQLIKNLDNEVSAIHAIYWNKVKQEIEKL